MNILYIDTSSNEKISVGIQTGKERFFLRRKITKQKAQVVLPMIDALLKKHKLSLKDIDEISVETGPGSFTGLRVGVSIANALGYALNISVNGMPLGTSAEPVYS